MPYFSGVRYKIEEKSNCWIAVSHKPNKGGYIFINRLFLKGYLHRMIYNERVKTLLSGERIRHSCKNKTCINPAHLYILMQ
jgi:hypothetical protein